MRIILLIAVVLVGCAEKPDYAINAPTPSYPQIGGKWIGIVNNADRHPNHATQVKFEFNLNVKYDGSVTGICIATNLRYPFATDTVKIKGSTGYGPNAAHHVADYPVFLYLQTGSMSGSPTYRAIKLYSNGFNLPPDSMFGSVSGRTGSGFTGIAGTYMSIDSLFIMYKN